MKKMPLILILLLLTMLSQSVQSKVLLVVEKGYLEGNLGTINRYLSDIINIDKNTAEVFPAGGFDKSIGAINIDKCRRLWYLLRDKYVSARGTSDPIEGAVFIGDIPVQMFAGSANAKENNPTDFYFMDFWSSTFNRKWNADTEIWQVSTLQAGFLDVNGYSGDDLEIWVSRVYATSIKNILTGKNGTTILGEYGVINEYLDRVNERMTLPAKVPPRSFSIGMPWPVWPNTMSLLYSPLYELGLSQVVPVDIEYPFATPSKWQAMLQAGPKGNINNGGFAGNDINSIDPSTQDIAGYEWAGTYFHSDPNQSCFVSAGGFLSLGGGDFISNTDEAYGLWKKETGGYSGTSWRMDMGAARDYSKFRTATWAYTIQNDGIYDVYLYSAPNPVNCTKVGVHTHMIVPWEWEEGRKDKIISTDPYIVVDTSRYFSIVNQRNIYSGNWCLIAPNRRYLAGDIMYSQLSNKDWGYLDPGLAPPWVADGPIRASALKLVNKSVTPNTSIIIDAVDNITDQTKTKRFLTSNSNRGFINFTKNGGPSKTPFFMNIGCNLSRFTTTNNLGLLYAMGYNGLITTGCGQEMGAWYDYSDYTKPLFQGKSFGKAYLETVKDFHGLLENDLNLLGAGTLRADAYKPYYNDYTISNKTITSNQKDAARNSITINNVTIGGFNVTSKISAGNTITISGPINVGNQGGNLTLVVDPTLK